MGKKGYQHDLASLNISKANFTQTTACGGNQRQRIRFFDSFPTGIKKFLRALAGALAAYY
jgi:hypothetical protein